MADRPIRVQLSRRKGWKMPPNTISVARPTVWGNRWKIGTPSRFLGKVVETRAEAVLCYRGCAWPDWRTQDPNKAIEHNKEPR